MINEKLDRMYDMIDEKIKIEEIVNVNGPEVLETRYRGNKTENQKQWNQALCKYGISEQINSFYSCLQDKTFCENSQR